MGDAQGGRKPQAGIDAPPRDYAGRAHPYPSPSWPHFQDVHSTLNLNYRSKDEQTTKYLIWCKVGRYYWLFTCSKNRQRNRSGGTTALDESGNLVGADDPYEQTRYIIAKIEKALNSAGAALTDVVRTRIFTTDISRWEEIGKAHGEFFRDIKPASTMVEVRALINPSMLVEIEATVILQENQ